MNKKIPIPQSSQAILALKVLAKEKEEVRKKLAITARNLHLKAKKLALIAKEKEHIRKKLAVTAKNLRLKSKRLAQIAKEKEIVRKKLGVTSGKLKKLYATLGQRVHDRTEDLENAKIAARNVLEDLQVEKGKLAKAKAKDEAMLASIGDGVVIVDLLGKITFMNQAAQDLLGWKSTEILDKRLFDIVPIENEKGELVPANARPMAIALATGGASTKDEKERMTPSKKTAREMYYVRKDKTRFPVAMNFSGVLLNGKVVGAIEVFRDITKEKEIDKAKSEFISLASHQLKTPPTAVKLLTERLLSGKMGTFTPKQKEYLADIHSSNQRMIELVNALLNVSRIELGAFTIQIQESDVYAIVNSIINELKPILDKKRLKLKMVSSEKTLLLMLDEPMFRIVISNLLTNSINYTAPGGEIAVVCKKVRSGQTLGGKLLKEESFVVTITDNGYGIPEVDQGKVFTKFFRADNTREKLTDGTGLGLYTVKSILDHSGGLIWFTSRENKGSSFYAAIPMAGMKVKGGVDGLIN